MPRIIKFLPTELSQGHSPWPPVPPLIVKTTNVFIEGALPVVVGDQYAPHLAPIPSHPVIAAIGSPNVFIGGIPVFRDGDPLSCGDIANSFIGTVFCNGGGTPGVSQQDPGNTIGFSLGLPVILYPQLLFPYRAFRDSGGNILSTEGIQASFKPEVYTPMTSELEATEYRNYPGLPFSTLEGGISLPSYAPDYARAPIRVTNFEVASTNLGNGISINSNTGVISGRVEDIGIPVFARIRVTSQFGSNPRDGVSWLTIPINYIEV